MTISIDRIEEASSHLYSAIVQSSVKLDDQIIMDHVRAAHVLMQSFAREWRERQQRGALEDHWRDCAIHKHLADPRGWCDCGLAEQISGKAERNESLAALKAPHFSGHDG